MSYTFNFLLFLLFICSPVAVHGGLVFSFHGKDFISYDNSLDENVQDVQNGMPSLKNRYDIRFKTIHPSGILLFAEGTQEDFIAMVLDHCKLRIVIHRGPRQKSTPPDELRVITGTNMCDGSWHFVLFTHSGNKVCISLDQRKQCHKLPGKIRTMDLDLHTFIAGIDKAVIKPSKRYKELRRIPNYRGCLRGVKLNQTNLLEAVSKKNRHIKIHGSLKEGCSGKVLGGLVGFNIESFLTLTPPARRALEISFNFRTYYENGLLLHSQSSLFVKLLLVSGYLEFQPYVQNKQQGIQHQLRFKVGKDLADGNWHAVKLYIRTNGFKLSVDKDEIAWQKPKHLKSANILTFKTIIFGRGMGHKSFIGCLNQLKINKNLIDANEIKQSIYSKLDLRSCPIRDFCFPNLCQHESKCSNKVKGFSCDCSGMLHTGKLCNEALYRSSCQEYAKLGLSRDSMCSVLPNKNITSTPFKVLCTMMSSRMSAAVINNEKKGWQKVESHTGYVVGPYLISDINYSLNFPNIKAVISGSRKCFQYIAINRTHNSLANASKDSQPHAYWMSLNKKNSNPMPITNGYIRDRSLLPIVAVMFSPAVVGSYYYVGPLKCIGTKKHSKTLPPSVNVLKFLNAVCNPLVRPRAYPPEDKAVVDRGIIALELTPGTSGKPKVVQGLSVSTATTAVTAAVTKDPTKTRQLNTNQTQGELNVQDVKDSSKTPSTKSWQFLTSILLVATGLTFILIMVRFLCTCHRRRNTSMGKQDEDASTKMSSNTEITRFSSCDDIGLPESDLWMKLNAGGYNVKTGKITYGHDIYRMT